MKGYDGLGSLKNRTALATFFGKTRKRILIAESLGWGIFRWILLTALICVPFVTHLLVR